MKLLFLTLMVAIFFIACKKSGGSDGCAAGLKLTANDTTPFVGDSVVITANQKGLYYQWASSSNASHLSAEYSDRLTLTPVEIRQSGWYYCNASKPGCNPVNDSIYINVQYDQGKPGCSLTNNLITNTAGAPDFNAYSVTKTYDVSYNAITITAYAGIGYPEYQFVFNSYNGNTEPKDGIYCTTSIAAFDPLQDADLINMNCLYGFYYFTSDDGQKIYVSHVNGKLRVSMCDLKADDTSGANGLFTGQLTEL